VPLVRSRVLEMEPCDSRSALRKPLSRSANRIEAECARSIGEAPNEWELMMQIDEPVRTIIVEPLQLPLNLPTPEPDAEPHPAPEPIPTPDVEPEQVPATE